MRRINFTLDDETIGLLEELANRMYGGNRSLAVRAAIESLASHSGTDGWVITGFTPVPISEEVHCHCCDSTFGPGDTLFRPVFERGQGARALKTLPTEPWLDCQTCAAGHL
jgi:hypothetical protein